MSQTIAGALVGGALGAFPEKPVIPPWKRLDTAQVQREAIAGNIAALPSLEELATKVNRFTFDEVSKMLEAAVPGFRSALARAGTNAASLVRGEIPEDISRMVRTSSAARALSGGFAGSGSARNLLARDLGLTSLDLQGRGSQQLLGLGTFASQTFPRFDFTTAFITPQQKLTFDFQQNLAEFQRDLLANQVAAAPDPAMAELGEAFDNFFNTWKNVGMGAFGMGMAGIGSPVPAEGGGTKPGGFGANFGQYSNPWRSSGGGGGSIDINELLRLFGR